jgi:hypothetical protein
VGSGWAELNNATVFRASESEKESEKELAFSRAKGRF